jgi:hypothetical protein
MEASKLVEIVLKHTDEKALAKDLAIFLVIPFLEKIVADSENKFDDAALGYVKEYVEKIQ